MSDYGMLKVTSHTLQALVRMCYGPALLGHRNRMLNITVCGFFVRVARGTPLFSTENTAAQVSVAK